MNINQKIRVLRILNRFNVGGPVYNAYLTKYLSSNVYETMLVEMFFPESQSTWGLYSVKWVGSRL